MNAGAGGLPELPEPAGYLVRDVAGNWRVSSINIHSNPDHFKRYYTADQMRAYATRALAGGGWMPIESAPRDGTPVVVAKVYGEQWVVGEARVLTDEQWWWAESDMGEYTADPIIPPPSHWQPLPPAPGPRDGEAEK